MVTHHIIMWRYLEQRLEMDDDDGSPAGAGEVPKRRGRPRIYDSPLSGAERARRYRKARQWDDEEIAECRDSVLMDRLRWALKNKEGSDDARAALDIYLEELVRRHHSQGGDALK